MTPVVLTGTGLATCAGMGTLSTWQRWLEGTPPFVAPSDEWAHWPTAILGRAHIDDCGPFLPVPKLAKYAGRSVALLVHAAHEALAEVRQSGRRVEPCEVGVYVASGQTGLEPATFFPALSAAWTDDVPDGYARLGGRPARLIDPYFSLTTLANLGVTFLSLMTGAEGPSTNVVHDATAGVAALGAALDDLEQGRVTRAVVGAHDSWLVEQAALSLARRGWLLPRGHTHLRPFDHDGAGMVAAEGAAVVVLERADDGEFHAARAASSPAARGADAGSVQVMGAATAMPSPVDEGDEWSARALGEACGAVGCTMGDVAVLQGSGLASLDRSAALAVAKAGPGVAAVTSCTGIVGHVGAATALLQAVLAAAMIRTGRIPPVAGQRRPFDGVPWAGPSTGALPFTAVTTLTRAVQGQVGAIRLRGVPSSAQESW